MQATRASSQPTNEQLLKEIGYYFELAKIYNSLKCCKKYPYADVMQIEAFRAAAGLDSAPAHYELGKTFLNEAKFRQGLQIDSVLNSTENLKRSAQLYEEAHAHLEAALKLGHVEAKRLKGLCYVNGWGVGIDTNKGFELIVASIEQEGSWDKVPQIFAAMGLNKPEFFAQIMQRRKAG